MKIVYFSLLITGLLFSNFSTAQCSGDRYKKQVFLNYNLTSDIIYGNNYDYNGNSQDLKMDIYEPSGDTAAERPVLIIAHGGNFLGGSKTGSDVAPLAEDFVKMGFVVASIDYRVGFEGLFTGTLDSVKATETVVRAVHDYRAAIRYLKMDYSVNGNTYGVDTSKIVVSGVSAGAITAVHVAYLDQMSELPSYIDTTKLGLGGGIEGNSGNPNYVSSGLMGVINIAGALRDTSWMIPNDIPLLSLHGDQDQTVPYNTDIIYLLGQYPIMEVDGSYSMMLRAQNLGLTNCLYTYVGADHVPHVGSAAYTDTTESVMRNFMATLLCNDALVCDYSGSIVGIQEQEAETLAIYPNPTTGIINFTTEGNITEINIFNIVGKKVWFESNIRQNKKTIDMSQFPKGVYLAKIKADDKEITKKIILE